MRRTPLTEAGCPVTGAGRSSDAYLGMKILETLIGWCRLPESLSGPRLLQALSVRFGSVLFDIDGYLKRYAGGLVVFDTDRSISAFQLSGGDVRGDDEGVSFTVWRLCGFAERSGFSGFSGFPRDDKQM